MAHGRRDGGSGAGDGGGQRCRGRAGHLQGSGDPPRQPYRVLEGALIAALAVGADRAVVALKASFERERSRVDEAIAEVTAAGWSEGVSVESFAGPDRYLFGEETALLEVLNGRPPFPRIAPPYRHGADEVAVEVGEGGGAAATTLVDETGATPAPPALVNNVETLANVPLIVGRGPGAFRTIGTAESPGTIVVTVSGRTERAGVAEVELGTPLREVIDHVGGGPIGSRVVAVLSGAANPLLPGDQLDAPISWEGLAAVGGGLGSAGFIVIDDLVDVVAVAQGVSRFLSVESCGQCTPCKQDGLAITALLDDVRSSRSDASVVDQLRLLSARVTDGARCYLAQQHQNIVESLLLHFPDALVAHAEGSAREAEPFLVAPLADITDGTAVLDESQAQVAADWGAEEDSGAAPAEWIDTRASS